MQSISLYLEKFKTIGMAESLLKRTVISIILSEVGFELRDADIKVRGGTIFVEAPPTVKSELLIKKEVIQKKLQEELKTKNEKEIR